MAFARVRNVRGKRHLYLVFDDTEGRRIERPADKRLQDCEESSQNIARQDAKLLEHACALWRDGRAEPHHVRLLLRYRVLTKDKARIQPVRVRNRAEDVTIEAAARNHPTALHEQANAQRDFDRHMDCLGKFTEWLGSDLLRDVTVHKVQQFTEYIRKDLGWKYDSRRHALLPIKWACAMAPSYGLPAVLQGIKLDRRHKGEEISVRVFAPDELGALLRAVRDDRPFFCAVALMGLCGLRPSEMVRIKHEDLDGDCLQAGQKNDASRRVLPLPKTLAKELRQLAKDRKGQRWLLRATHNAQCNSWIASQWFSDYWPEDVRYLPPGCLRKTFATLAADRWELTPAEVEFFLGHKSGDYAPVTTRHYRAKDRAEKHRDAAARLDRALLALLRPPRRQSRRSA